MGDAMGDVVDSAMGDAMGDVVDSVNSWLVRSRERFGNSRRGHAKLPRHIGEGEPELRDEVDRQGGPHGRDLAPAAAHLQFRETDPRLPTPAGITCGMIRLSPSAGSW